MGATKSYITGFVSSILLTLAAYFAVTNHVFSGGTLTSFILGLAIVQLLVQVIFFLHLGQEKNPRWNLVFFVSTVGIILIIVVASIWIMANLNYNMSPQEMTNYMMSQERIRR